MGPLNVRCAIVESKTDLEQKEAEARLDPGFKNLRQKLIDPKTGLGLISYETKTGASGTPQFLDCPSWTVRTTSLVAPTARDSKVVVDQQKRIRQITGYEALMAHLTTQDMIEGPKKQVTVAVIDTGTFGEHACFEGVSIEYYDAAVSTGQPTRLSAITDRGTHGSQVSSLLCGEGMIGHGVVKVIVYTVQDARGGTSNEYILAALFDAALNRNVDVVNMSLGLPPHQRCVGEVSLFHSSIASICKRMTKCCLVAAAGNAPFDFQGIHWTADQGVFCPANAEWPLVLAVGAVDDSESQASFSCYDGAGFDGDPKFTKPQILCIGDRVYGASAEDKDLMVLNSGTSMACPIVAGCVALLRAFFPAASREEIYEAIISSSRIPGPGQPPCKAGVIDLLGAFNALSGNKAATGNVFLMGCPTQAPAAECECSVFISSV